MHVYKHYVNSNTKIIWFMEDHITLQIKVGRTKHDSVIFVQIIYINFIL